MEVTFGDIQIWISYDDASDEFQYIETRVSRRELVPGGLRDSGTARPRLGPGRTPRGPLGGPTTQKH